MACASAAPAPDMSRWYPGDQICPRPDRCASMATKLTRVFGYVMPPIMIDAIEHCLKVYDINRLNRNQLTHFLPSAFTNSDLARLKGPRFDPQPIPDTLEDMRRVADEVILLVNYLGGIVNLINKRQVSEKPDRILPSLPDKPPLPERLWKPPPPPQGRKEQPGKGPG